MKDPAILFYYDTWLTSTAEMDADVRSWYLELLIHQYDKKDLPNDPEKLAVLCRVKFSEYDRFNHVLNHVLHHKFKQNENGRLENSFAIDVLKKREQFLEQRTKSGNIGAIIKLAHSIKGYSSTYITKLKKYLFSLNIDEINKHKDKHVLEHMLNLYINGDGDGNKNEIELEFVLPEFKETFEKWLKYKKDIKDMYKNKESIKLCYEKLLKLSKNNSTTALEIVNNSMANNWKGLFLIKEEQIKPLSNEQNHNQKFSPPLPKFIRADGNN